MFEWIFDSFWVFECNGKTEDSKFVKLMRNKRMVRQSRCTEHRTDHEREHEH
jgi:hypothetical protein